MDPAGIEPAFSDVDADVLAIYTTDPDPQIYYKQKNKPLQTEIYFPTSEHIVVYTNISITIIIAEKSKLSIAIRRQQ